MEALNITSKNYDNLMNHRDAYSRIYKRCFQSEPECLAIACWHELFFGRGGYLVFLTTHLILHVLLL